MSYKECSHESEYASLAKHKMQQQDVFANRTGFPRRSGTEATSTDAQFATVRIESSSEGGI